MHTFLGATAINPASTTRPPSHKGRELLADFDLMISQPNATSVDAGFFCWEIETGEVICDPVTHRLHGLPENVSADMDSFLSRVPESDLPDVIKAMGQMVRTCGTYQIEYRVYGEGGGVRSMEARGRVLAGPGGKPARMIGVVTDTTAVGAAREAERFRLRERADRTRRMQRFTAALASAVTVEGILSAAREGLRAHGADSLIMIAERGGRLAVAGSFGFDQEVVEALGGVQSTCPTPASTAILQRHPVYLCSPEALARDYPQLADVAARSPQRAWVALPAVDSHGHVGACLFGFPEPQDFLADEQALLLAASGLLTQSLERARMFEAEHALVTALQHWLLPRGGHTPPGVSIATRYQSAISGMEIGGDFYDVVELADGRVALVIGDVQGHNMFAASLMGQLRTAVHAYAWEGHGPAEVMSRANEWLAGLNPDPDTARFATCCLMVLNPVTGELAICRAGHPRPMLVTPGEPARILDCDGGLPLGIEAGTTYSTVEMKVAPGSVLMLATDGLLDTDTEDSDFNISCLLNRLEQGADTDLEVLADNLLTRARPSRHGDDVALLLARLVAPPGKRR